MKLYHYGKWTIYVILDREDKRRGYKALVMENHASKSEIPNDTLMYKYVTNGSVWYDEEYITDRGSDPDITGHARYVLNDMLNHLRISKREP